MQQVENLASTSCLARGEHMAAIHIYLEKFRFTVLPL